MKRTTALLAGGLLAFALGASACGSERRVTTSPTSPTPPSGSTGWDGTGSADTLLLQVGTGQPELVIAADGTLYRTLDPREVAGRFAARIAPPAPYSAQMVSAKVSPTGLARIHDRADELGLLKDPGTYTPTGADDVLGEYLVLSDAKGTYVHDTDMLYEPSKERDAKRRAFSQFMADLRDLDALTGGEIGTERPFVPERFVVSLERSYSDRGDNDWPKGVEIVEGCVTLPVDKFANGPLGRFRTADGQDVVVRPVIAGVECPDDVPVSTDVIVRLSSSQAPGPRFVLLADGRFFAVDHPMRAELSAAQPPAPVAPVGLVTGTINAASIDKIWERAADLDLLRHLDDRDYGIVTDSGSTTLRLVHDGTEYVHDVAGLASMSNPERKALRTFIDELTRGLDQMTGYVVHSQPYQPDAYNVTKVYGPTDSAQVRAWPDSAPLVEGCVTVDRARFSGEVTGWYSGDGAVFAVYPSIPGDDCS